MEEIRGCFAESEYEDDALDMFADSLNDISEITSKETKKPEPV